MSRKVIFIALLLGLVAVGIFWFQSRWYRATVLLEATTTPLIVVGTPNHDDIPSIDKPVYESVAAADVYLHDAGYGLLVEVGRRARFYPFQILVWHHAVNDTLNGRDLLVTHDPLTFSSAVYDRTDTFGVSGKLWNNNTLLYDRTTESLWSQLRGEAIEGTLLGRKLSRYPSRVMTWADYRGAYSSGQVLSRETGFDRDYTQNPYEGYDESPAIWFPLDHEDTRLAPKSLVYGVMQSGTAMAFPVDKVEEFDTIQSIVADEVLVPAYWFAWSAMYPETQIYSISR